MSHPQQMHSQRFLGNDHLREKKEKKESVVVYTLPKWSFLRQTPLVSVMEAGDVLSQHVQRKSERQ